MNGDDMGERDIGAGNHRYGGWTATGTGAGAVMAGATVVGRCRVIGRAVVVSGRGGGSRESLSSGWRFRPTVRRAPHSPLGAAHEERQPER